MAGFLAVRDPHEDRRRRAVSAATAALVGRGLRTGTIAAHDVEVVWGAATDAPVDHHASVVLLGDAMAEGRRLSATTWRKAWSGTDLPAPTDGVHVAIAVDADGTLTIDGDLFGLLPIVHTEADGVVLVASSPALLRAHESFRPAIDRRALAELLLVDAVLGDATVLRDVRRLAPGHVLRLAGGTAIETRRTWSMPMTGALADVAPIRRLVDGFHEELVDACARHLDRGPIALLLSGGLDSRLLGGALRAAGLHFDAVTYGTPRDSEARYAARVASTLGAEHRILPDDERRLPFTDVVAWEGLVSTPSLDHPGMGRRYPAIVSGFLMDATAGASHVDWAYDASTGAAGFEPFLRKLNQHAVPVDDLRILLGPDEVDAALARVERSWTSSGASDAERAWRFDLAHRQRFWVGSRVPDQLQDGWPVLPHLDRRVLEVVGAMPPAVVASRLLEIETCIAHHPDLARLPLERTTFDSRAIVPRTGDMVRDAVARKVRSARAALRVPVDEPRYFTRLFDVEGDGWRAAREHVESARSATRALFDADAFDRLVPPVDRPWSGPRSYPGANRSKLLLGVMALLAAGVEP